MDWRQADDRVFLVRFELESDLSPQHQVGLITALRASTQGGPTALLFDLRVPRLSADLLNYWVDVVVELGARLTHVGMITQSTSLRAMTGAFSLAVGRHRRDLAVEVFSDEASALAWASRGEGHPNL
jgi:hypothetical protein